MIPAAGIPTAFNGTRYRSRLEARWAAFFDWLKWDAHYEPFDLNGYIPDFVLHGRDERILVEVKPVSGMDDPLFKETTAKIEKSGWKHDALIVSYFLPTACEDRNDDRPLLCVGWIGDPPWPCWRFAPFNYTAAQLGFRANTTPYRDRIFGGGGPKRLAPYLISFIEKHWHEAGNAVQWRAS